MYKSAVNLQLYSREILFYATELQALPISFVVLHPGYDATRICCVMNLHPSDE